MVDSLCRLLSQIHCLDSLTLATEIIYGLDALLEVGQRWLPDRQKANVDHLGMANILPGLDFQREREGELQHFLGIGMIYCIPSFPHQLHLVVTGLLLLLGNFSEEVQVAQKHCRD